MQGRSLVKSPWLRLEWVAALGRSVPGLVAIVEGAPRAEWLPAITMAAMWILLGAVWLLRDLYGPEDAEGSGFTTYDWATAATFVAITVVAAGFVHQGYELTSVPELVMTPFVLVLWLFVRHRDASDEATSTVS